MIINILKKKTFLKCKVIENIFKSKIRQVTHLKEKNKEQSK